MTANVLSHPRNLCATVEARGPRYETQPCSVPRRKVTPLYARVAAEGGYYGPEYIWDLAHSWDDHTGGVKGGRCTRCGKALKEVRVRINPKTGEPAGRSSLAREISMTPADVPPVRFTGRCP